ncbi:Phosphatidylinositol 4-phosphate 5-kinase 9 [Hibiscus syriacus]|uniref:Phosphatidylinositol 4-phosphate 5-kinase n=1 Tax=Hibiscus syriacus TaxID=106335 RepID=A0A6A2XK37_HIBSY|nr:phosphatidylinositol 4-phosphate 5-kinase 7-like [Hibiscus syriacus]KAE8670200.1 Phosphatidylinositol 4-phosphate 5-kinase 9 [Hibiscus syriacus]
MTCLKNQFDEDSEIDAEPPYPVSCNVQNVERLNMKAFSNGDFYVGDFKEALPHGKGKYTWSDGTVYEGDWEGGEMTGKGVLLWPSGEKYNGNISGGCLHGSGTLTSTNGSLYKGQWRMNIQHGYGRMKYSNSDVYEGEWKDGEPEGNGRYFWNNRNKYTGNWKCGKMHGRGVMEWGNGDQYNGCWLNGFKHGSGIYQYADGGYYFGTWTRGLKDGKGVFYPAGSISLGYDNGPKRGLSQCSLLNLEERAVKTRSVERSFSEKISVSGVLRSSSRISHKNSESSSHSDSAREFVCHNSSGTFSLGSDDGQSVAQENTAIVYEREYIQGVMIKERVRDYTELSQKAEKKTKRYDKETEKIPCFGIFKGKNSYYLMLNLQLGIRYTVGKITPVPKREVRIADFGDRARITMFFPRRGSHFTPPHKSIDFYWKDYCPMVFRNLREMFKLDAAEYMMSICGYDGLTQISSPGKSGSIFYLSQDDKFMIKTLKKSELKVLLRMLPKYYNHVKAYENTLITKIFGVHQITLPGRRKVRFVVMGNMFCTELRIHRRYDLKGSTHGRCTDKEKIHENTTLKDLDLSYEFHMDKSLQKFLFHQIAVDCNFLKSQQIIDYSLLLGLHFRPTEQLNGLLEPPNIESSPADQGLTTEGEVLFPSKGLLLVAHEPSSVNTEPGPHIRGRPLRAFSLGDREVDVLVPGTGRLQVQLGVNMPAQAIQKLSRDEADSAEVELFEVYDVVIYMGIIDILQEYNVKKKAEHAYKAVKFDPLSISLAEPELYAQRFIDFLQKKVFPEQP